MDINELEKYRLGNAVKFHQQLNPQLWGKDEHLLPEVVDTLRAIADDFREFLGVDDLQVKDITVSGSNAAYTYTDDSDIDLHLVVDLPEADANEVYRELFDAKKYQYNNQHNYTVRGYPVELYVQNANESHESQGIYSITKQDWVRVPSRREPAVDDISVNSKYQDLVQRIEQAVDSGDLTAMDQLAAKITRMRRAGLAETGEFGPENLAFKLLRRQGQLEQLHQARSAARDRAMSLDERRKKKKKPGVKWGSFGGMWFPGYHNIGQPPDTEHLTPADVGGESVAESQGVDIGQAIRDFAKFCGPRLNIQRMPRIRLRRDPAWSERSGTFGRYEPDSGVIVLSVANRHPVDVMRTLAHELTHHRQAELGPIPDDAGETGSSFEDSANAMAGRVMRDFAAAYPNYFDRETIGESSGYIPVNDREARDPRYSMAVTADVQPGEPKRQAAKLGFKTDPAGRPPQARTNGLIEQLSQQWQALKESRDTEPVLEEEDLTEVAMSPGALRQWAASGAAEGMQAGFEAELIFQGLGADEIGQGDPEPDWDEDRRATYIEGVLDFFNDGNYSDMSRRDIERLREGLLERFLDWQGEQIDRSWQEEGESNLRAFIENEDEFDQEEAEEMAAEELGDDASSEHIGAWVQDRFGEFVESIWKAGFGNRIYDLAYEDYRDNMADEFDESDWLNDEGWSMSDIANEFDLNWPYVTFEEVYGEEGFNEENAQNLADDLERVLGVKTRVSGGYHSTARDAETWIFEPDSSLDADETGDMPVEIVSPPMPLAEAVDILPRFFAWAAKNNAYANKSTGFHMSVSMPGHEGDRLDYTKLALLLGDSYVLEQFGRAANTFAVSALTKIQDRIRSVEQQLEMPTNPYLSVVDPRGNRMDVDVVGQLMEQMRVGISELATRALARPHGFGKYVSINPKDNYIEFRSAGGRDYFNDIDKIQNILLRYARATAAAMDPAAERQEYAKKLYKLLSKTETETVTDPRTGRQRTQAKPQGDSDPVWIFSRYAAGELPRSALKSFIENIRKQRSAKKEPPAAPASGYNTPQPDDDGNYEIFNTRNPAQSVFRFRAESPDEALAYLSAWRRDLMPQDQDYRQFMVRPVTDQARPAAPAGDDRGDYVIRSRNNNETGGNGPVLFRFAAANNAEAIRIARQWAESQGVDRGRVWLDHVSGVPAEILGTRPPLPASNPSGNYEIFDRSDNSAVYQFDADNDSAAIDTLDQYRQQSGSERRAYGVRRAAQSNQSQEQGQGQMLPFMVTYSFGQDGSRSKYRIDATSADEARRNFIELVARQGGTRNMDNLYTWDVEQLR